MKRVLLILFLLFTFPLFIVDGQSPANDQSLLDRGIQLKNEGKFIEAFDTLSRIRIRFPGSTLLPVAEYQMGIATLYDGRPVEAALQFQQVISKFPESEQAKQARDMNAILYRLYIAPATNKTIYNPDPSFSAVLADVDDPKGMGMDSKRQIWLVDRGKKVLYTFDASGKMINSTTVLSPFNISVSSKDDVLVANDTTLYMTTRENISFPRINPQTQARMGYMEEIRSAAMNSKGEYFVVSGKQPGVGVYDNAGNPVRGAPTFGRASDAEYEKVLIDSRDNVVLLNRKRDSLSVFDPTGKVLLSLSKTGRELTFGKIDDFGIDAANHLYLLTNDPRGIAIFSPQGKFLRFIASEKNTAVFLDDSKLITIGPAGGIYVLDKGVKRIIKFG